ncbi:MAG: efflux RND transporter periplasmic adaptor subunit [Acidobacteria bacterium]|nr:MAG: efflux RND transporter periplasmic adaptor subunit [Acidobacteriota bacterium]PYU55021.1 MAG: efflux RND transporter periplasmic adaptor subunit [Acidobacteriota bacterium]PYU71032.1 MAG: efflux RND transporter periplasmic adaptor subunit [Acidobacteriota bacterium]
MSLKYTFSYFIPLLLWQLTASGCNRANPQAAGPQMPPPPLVTVAKAQKQDVPLYLDEIGKSGGSESVTVTPQVGGRITERHFQDGADLTKGALLFVIDPRPYQAQLDSARASLAQAKAALALAKAQFARDEELVGSKAISKQDYDTKKNTVDVDLAQVESAEAVLETAKLNLEYCYIHSPIEGRAGARLVDVGNVVQANTTGLLLIQRLDPIYADFTVTEGDLPEVQKEMSRGSLKTLVRLPSDPENRARSGKLTFLDNAVQNGTGTVNLRATMSNPDHHFWPGQFVNVRLVLATQKNAVLIPNQATQISQKGPFVYVVKPDGTADLRPVTLGQRQGDNVVITQGVAAGENVIVTGQMTVPPGGKVRVDTGVAPGPGGAPADAGAAGTK